MTTEGEKRSAESQEGNDKGNKRVRFADEQKTEMDVGTNDKGSKRVRPADEKKGGHGYWDESGSTERI